MTDAGVSSAIGTTPIGSTRSVLLDVAPRNRSKSCPLIVDAAGTRPISVQAFCWRRYRVKQRDVQPKGGVCCERAQPSFKPLRTHRFRGLLAALNSVGNFAR